MVDVRSTVLGSGVVSGTDFPVVVRCPADLTLLVKRVDLWNPYASTQVLTYVTRETQGVSVGLQAVELATNTVSAWEGWLALMPGDVLNLSAGGGTGVYYWISGAALHGVETVYQPEPSPGRLPYLPGLVPDSGAQPKSL